MKIGILTFHEGINHGGYFQVFSTYQYLKGQGFDVEVINYKNKKHFWSEKISLFLRKNPLIAFNNLKKVRKFKKAMAALKMSDFSMDIKSLDTSKYDVIVVGSDIVWNYDWAFLGKDPIYFGEGLAAKTLISYAPSCGSANIELENIPEFVNGMKNFKALSVRDEKTAKLAKKITGIETNIVVDPAFLIDHKKYQAPAREFGDYLLVYAFRLHAEEIIEIKSFAEKNNLTTVSVAYSNAWCDFNLVSVGPFEWLTYFDNAKFVVSGTFHGTLFAIKYQKPFAVFGNESINSKLTTILKKSRLSNRLVQGGNLENLLLEKIDYDDVSERLSPFIESSKKYLINAIEKS